MSSIMRLLSAASSSPTLVGIPVPASKSAPVPTRLVGALGLLALLATGAVVAQEGSPGSTENRGSVENRASTENGGSVENRGSFEDAVEVRVVEVEVWVQETRGAPVLDLDQDDFELFVDGQRKKIEYFEPPREAVDTGTAGASTQPDAPVREPEPSYLALYLDRHFLEKGDFAKVKKDLARFLETELRPEDQVLLATANEELEVLESFTPDRQAILRHLRKLEGAPDGGKLAGDFRNLMRDLRGEQSARTTSSFSVGRPSEPEERLIRKQSPESYLEAIETFHRESVGEMRYVAEQLSELIYTLSGLPGTKQVLYVGGPLPTDSAKVLFETWRDVFERAQKDDDFNSSAAPEAVRAQRLALGMSTRHGEFRVGADLFREVATSASVAGITFHTLGLASLRRSRNVMASRMDVEVGTVGRGTSVGGLTDSRGSLATDDGMQTLALLTGGRHLEGRSKFAPFFDHLGDDLRSRYVLGFTGSPEADSGPRRVRVELADRKRARKSLVRHRESLLVKTREVELAERTLAALMIGEDSVNPLDVEIGVRVPEARVEGWVLEISVRVPTNQLVLVPDRETHIGQLTIFATAGKLGSELAPVMKARVPVRFADDDLPTALAQRIEYVFELRTPQDPGRVSVTVRDDLGPTESTVTAAVTQLPSVDPDPARPAPRGTEATGDARP